MSKAKPVYCDDWACPAHVSCARHFGRSNHYAAMSEVGYTLEKLARDPQKEFCPSYEFDEPQTWLLFPPKAIHFQFAKQWP